MVLAIAAPALLHVLHDQAAAVEDQLIGGVGKVMLSRSRLRRGVVDLRQVQGVERQAARRHGGVTRALVAVAESRIFCVRLAESAGSVVAS